MLLPAFPSIWVVAGTPFGGMLQRYASIVLDCRLELQFSHGFQYHLVMRHCCGLGTPNCSLALPIGISAALSLNLFVALAHNYIENIDKQGRSYLNVTVMHLINTRGLINILGSWRGVN